MDRSLRAFLAIAEKRSLTAAAEALGLAQPSLTKVLRRLETEYGARLFERLPRGVALTPSGESLYRRGKAIELEYRFAREEIASLARGYKSVLRVGAGPLYHLVYLPRIFDAVLERFPDTRLELFADSTTETLPMLARGELDIAMGNVGEHHESTEAERIFLKEVESGIVVRPDHPLAGQDTISALDLAESRSRWVLYQRDTGANEHLNLFFLHAGLMPPKIAVQTSSIATGFDIVRLGNYFMTAPLQLADTVQRAQLVIRPPSRSFWSFPSGMWVRHTSLQYPVVRFFIENAMQLVGR